MARRREHLSGLPEDGFDIAETSCATVFADLAGIVQGEG
jgi:hypothetical protein